ncbi:molybdopterin-synthase adenylyltransferase MoeB [Pseudoalteromonas sp. T1lg48]|uniref:molybdopterin-synthase adenylyltransferase MoeB n=1 Tax=Pseudoalteromonas sp. T1lg48 TaxID=2077100 RepID=UPI001F29912A|nr:molybdopterin-synthase adenylyltransferase MoeB [Pseudoalteromonas sp. T1lg48]
MLRGTGLTKMQELNDAQALRYCRHILLPQVDYEGQEKLLASKVLVIGLGGLGSACVPYLASAGIGTLTLVDFDTIEVTNLQRQVIYAENEVGQSKAHCAARFVAQQNSACHVDVIAEKLTEEQLTHCIAEHDLVLDCTDNLATRQAINHACYKSRTPLVSGAAIRFEGQVTSFTYAPGTPCYQCFSDRFSEQNLSCVESGVIAPLVGIIGSYQALEAIKILIGIGRPYVGRLLMFDGLSGDCREFSYPAQQQCPVCNG